MFQLSNETPFAAERSIQLDPSGVQHWVVIVKATYHLEPPGLLAVADEQEPVAVVPRYAGEDGRSSLLRESEMTFAHPGTDVIVNGTACAAAGRPVEQMDVHVSVARLRKTVRVFGERKWVPIIGDLMPSRPVRFDRMPLVWERAFGGAVTAGEGSPAYEARNPIGRGFGVSRKQLVDQFMPNVEDPAAPIRSWRDRPVPAGLGAVTAHWSPRKERAGTYDEAWQADKLPLLPDDFDPLFFAAASPGLHTVDPLRGGEPVRLEGLSESGPIAFALPHEVLLIDTWVGSTRVRQAVQMDRVIIEPTDRRVVVVWRSSLRCGLRFREIRRTRVDYKVRISR